MARFYLNKYRRKLSPIAKAMKIKDITDFDQNESLRITLSDNLVSEFGEQWVAIKKYQLQKILRDEVYWMRLERAADYEHYTWDYFFERYNGIFKETNNYHWDPVKSVNEEWWWYLSRDLVWEFVEEKKDSLDLN